MKNIYQTINNILQEAATTHGVAPLSSPLYKKNTGDVHKPETTDLRLSGNVNKNKTVTYDPATKKNVSLAKQEVQDKKEFIAGVERIAGVGNEKSASTQEPAKPAPAAKPAAAAKPAPAAKPETDFNKEFARQMKDKGPGGTFTWKDPKTGKSSEIALKYADDKKSPAADKSKDDVVAASNAVQQQAVSQQKSNERRAADVDRMKKMAADEIEGNAPAPYQSKSSDPTTPDAPSPEFTPAQKEKSDAMWAKARQEQEDDMLAASKPTFPAKIKSNKLKTNEDNQMSINKKFSVTDSMYQTVMEVLKKSSGGTVPSTNKEKKLASMHGNPNVITHGDVLKARGVKMKESVQVDEAKKKIGEYTEGSHTTKVYHLSGIHNEGDPYVVQLHKDGKHHESADYFTDDKDDAHNTAKDMVKRAAKTTNEELEQVDEISKATAKRYLDKTVDPVYGIPKSGTNTAKRLQGIIRASRRLVSKKNTTGSELMKKANKRAAGESAMEEKSFAAEGSIQGGVWTSDAPKKGQPNVPAPSAISEPIDKKAKDTTKINPRDLSVLKGK
jgi:hypothetical protein